MGVCVTKVDRDVVPPEQVKYTQDETATRRIKASLLDLKKLKKVPLLTLESNKCFRDRISRKTGKRPSCDIRDTMVSDQLSCASPARFDF